MALGVWVFCDSSAVAQDSGCVVPGKGRKDEEGTKGPHVHSRSGSGTLGYGAPGLYPGFQGFGLGYHPGYGYGGDALGVGADGGYPLYGGPGYPHCEPRLRRIGGINPFPYYGGPGYPSPDHPNFFGGVGPLVPDQPVVTVATDRGEPIEATDYGAFTGGVPNPEALFAPFTARAAAGVSSVRTRSSYSTAIPTNPSPEAGLGPPPPSTTPAAGANPNLPAARKYLGIESEPLVDANGARRMRISKVSPGSAAEKAGLHAGDVIYSINGYLTQKHGNLEWIIVNSAPSNILKMNVRTASDGQDRTIAIQLP